jgi:hypothetical protein
MRSGNMEETGQNPRGEGQKMKLMGKKKKEEKM